jgi:hypothetical protein
MNVWFELTNILLYTHRIWRFEGFKKVECFKQFTHFISRRNREVCIYIYIYIFIYRVLNASNICIYAYVCIYINTYSMLNVSNNVLTSFPEEIGRCIYIYIYIYTYIDRVLNASKRQKYICIYIYVYIYICI